MQFVAIAQRSHVRQKRLAITTVCIARDFGALVVEVETPKGRRLIDELRRRAEGQLGQNLFRRAAPRAIQHSPQHTPMNGRLTNDALDVDSLVPYLQRRQGCEMRHGLAVGSQAG